MFGSFKTRSKQLERIDTGDYTPAEYELWQREMVFIQRWLGEARAVRRCEIGQAASVLDVGAGSGELLNTIRSDASDSFLCGIDLEPLSTVTIRERGFSAVRCSGARLPFADSSFDYVISSLVFHHLSNETAVEVLKEMARVSRLRVFVIDLRRSPLAYFAYRLVGSVLFQKLTREDGSLSIKRAFTDSELRDIGECAGLKDLRVERSALFRLVLSWTK